MGRRNTYHNKDILKLTKYPLFEVLLRKVYSNTVAKGKMAYKRPCSDKKLGQCIYSNKKGKVFAKEPKN